ncbi:MAG: LLM class flavin-dependent oxidoreductase [Microthrixaceae bacterium]|nr:LLM class flavin-dependent oxidoreductase [Microthrixaceae bacterium]
MDFHGQYYDFERLRMDPHPPAEHPVPIYVGGHSDAGLRRAARLGDGWIGAQVLPDELSVLIGGLRDALDEAGRADDAFEVKATPMVAATPDEMARLAEMGLTDVITVPWYFSGGDPRTPNTSSTRWHGSPRPSSIPCATWRSARDRAPGPAVAGRRRPFGTCRLAAVTGGGSRR